MGHIIDKKFYKTTIPYSTYPELKGEIIITSDNRAFNDYMENVICDLLKDMYYGNLDDFDLFK